MYAAGSVFHDFSSLMRIANRAARGPVKAAGKAGTLFGPLSNSETPLCSGKYELGEAWFEEERSDPYPWLRTAVSLDSDMPSFGVSSNWKIGIGVSNNQYGSTGDDPPRLATVLGTQGWDKAQRQVA